MPLVFGRSIFGFVVVSAPPVSGWTDPDLTNASYDSVSLDISSTTGTFVSSIKIGDSDTKIYVGSNSNDRIYQWNLSTASDLSSATLHGSFSTSSQSLSANRPFFKPDGTKMYVADGSTEDVYQYSLSTAWDVTTASYDSKVFSPSEVNYGTGIFFKPDGTKFYYEDYVSETTFQYTLSTAWDISTASYDSKSFTTTTQASDKYDIFFSPNGDKFYKISLPSDTIYQYSLSTAWDVSTGSYDSVSFSVTSQASIPVSFAFNSIGSKLYVLDTSADTIYQYSTVAPAWSADLSSASYDSKSFSFTSQDTIPFGLAFNNNGTKMYMLGGFNDTVYQYSLSTAFDVSTASYDSVSFSVASQDSNSFNITFNNNGTKMYMVGATGDSVYQYSLSTSFDMSTASYDSVSFSVASQDITPYDVAFGSSGTKMYIVGFNNDSLYQYSLSTAYDLSTASYDSVSFSVATQETQPTDFAISSDGTEIYVVGLANDTVYKYTLSTAWDLSTASYASVSFSVASQENVPRNVTFNSSGSKMYIVGSQNNSVYQYST